MHACAVLIVNVNEGFQFSPSMAKAFWPHGNAACPCINPWTHGSGVILNGHAPAVKSSSCAITRDGDNLCYPETYGSSGCAAYDHDASPECARTGTDSKPDWCPQYWCFVDASNCDQPSARSEFFLNVTPALSFSYEACGYVNSYNAGSALDELRSFISSRPGQRLRVSFPRGDSGNGFTIVGASPYPDATPKVEPFRGVGGSNRSGASLVFMDSIFAEHGFAWEEVGVSAPSAAYAPSSSFTACVHDVALGLTEYISAATRTPIQSGSLFLLAAA